MDLFDEVAEIVRGMVPDELGVPRCQPRRYGLKVWFGAERPPREHYEAQVLGPAHVDGARVLALEIGFHAEHAAVSANDAAIESLLANEKKWRRGLGKEAIAGPFLGRATWRRISESWLDPDLSDEELPLEVATRLIDYVTALEPVRRIASRP